MKSDGADGRDYWVRPAGTGSGGLESDLQAEMNGGKWDVSKVRIEEEGDECV